MKKIIFSISLLIISYGCKKEDVAPTKPSATFSSSCNCGLVQSDDVNDYSVVIKNSCSGNNKKFYLQEGDWMNAYVGSNYCITNTTSW